MTELDIFERLRYARLATARMIPKALENLGVIDYINTNSPDLPKWRMCDRIDYILNGNPTCPHCSGPRKFHTKFCSSYCRANFKDSRDNISRIQKENSTTRMANLRATLLEKYGTTKVQETPGAKEKTKKKRERWQADIRSETFKKYGLDINQCTREWCLDNCGKYSYEDLSEKVFNGMPEMTIFRFFEYIGYEHTPTTRGSKGQREILEYIESLGFVGKYNDRKLIKPKEIDILIEDKNLAIEFNGMYFHRNDKRGPLEKYNLCKRAGVRLITIMEDEWMFKRDICKNIIASALGKLSNKIHARKCCINKLTFKDMNEFLESNHMQGGVSNGDGYGLYYNGELVSCMVVGVSRFRKDKSLELFRFVSKIDTNVVGGFSKLLSHIKSLKNDQPIYTYADLRYSDGATYRKFGSYVSQSDPGYFWVHKRNFMQRISRMKVQKHKLAEFLGSSYDPSLSESENLSNAGYIKIYDCGNLVFIL